MELAVHPSFVRPARGSQGRVASIGAAAMALVIAGLAALNVNHLERGLRSGEARLAAEGVVEASVAGGPFLEVSRELVLRGGDRVRVVDGSAVLELPHAGTVELRSGSWVRISDRATPAIHLEAGDLLAIAARQPITIDGVIAEVEITGAAKLRRAASLPAGVYRGEATLITTGGRFQVPRYRQAAAAGTGLLPSSPEPLELRAADEWDRRMLGGVLVLSEEIAAYERDWERELAPGTASAPELFEGAAPALRGFPVTPAMLAGRSPGENLVGLTMVALDRGDLATRLRRVFGFRAQGASWGLVAADRDLDRASILTNLHAALARARLAAVASPGPAATSGFVGPSPGRTVPPEPTTATPPAPPTPTHAAPAPAESGTPTTPAPPDGTPEPEPPEPPAPSPDGPWIGVPPTGAPVDEILQPVTEPLTRLLSGLLDTLLGPPPGSSSSVVVVAPAGRELAL